LATVSARRLLLPYISAQPTHPLCSKFASDPAGKWNADWKRRFFVLSEGELAFYADEKAVLIKKPKGSINLAGTTELRPYSGGAHGHAWPPSSSRFELATLEKTYVLSAGDRAADKHVWLRALAHAMGLPDPRGEDEGEDAAAAHDAGSSSSSGGGSVGDSIGGRPSLPAASMSISSFRVAGLRREGWLLTRRALGGWKRRFVVLQPTGDGTEERHT
jgi:hypothetical protein